MIILLWNLGVGVGRAGRDKQDWVGDGRGGTGQDGQDEMGETGRDGAGRTGRDGQDGTGRPAAGGRGGVRVGAFGTVRDVDTRSHAHMELLTSRWGPFPETLTNVYIHICIYTHIWVVEVIW